MLSKQIFDIFIRHDTLLHPDAVEHIQTQDDPMGYVNKLVRNIENFPLVLTMGDIQNLESEDLLEMQLARENEQDDEQSKTRESSENIPVIHTRKGQVEPELSYFGDSKSSDGTESAMPASTTLSGGLMTTDVGAVGAVRSASREVAGDVDNTDEQPGDPPLLSAPQDFDHDLKIISDITGRSTCEGKLADFSLNVNHRFKTLKNLIKNSHPLFRRTLPINKINLHLTYEIYFIGMISDINKTKKDNFILNVEDETGDVKVFINKDKPELDMRLLNDEVVGITGEVNTKLGMVMAKRIIRPEPPRHRTINHSENDVDAVFISDIHVGSIQFMEKEWTNFIKWLNGDHKLAKHYTADKVRYLVVAGDLVDGIGIYPDQEKELDIMDIFKQYETLGHHLEDVPEHIKLILLPGNHDAVRQAEPQPALKPEFQKHFDPDQTLFVGNPCYLSLEGVEVLAYHGRSFDDVVKFIPEATYTNPILPMKEILIRRHLVPIYGERTPVAPEHSDLLLMDRLPDIFVTGHVHTTGCERYNNIMMINASAWQSQTSYQKTLNFNPDPCKAYLVSLNSVRAAKMDFSNPNF